MLDSDNTSNSTEDVSTNEEIYEETGDIIFEAALLRYLPGLDETQTGEFEKFIEVNVEKESFMEDLYQAYPEFGQLIDEEMINMKTDFDAVLAEIAPE